MSGFFVGLQRANDLPSLTGGLTSTHLVVIHDQNAGLPGNASDAVSAHPAILWPDARADQRTSALTLTSSIKDVVTTTITTPVSCRISYDFGWAIRMPFTENPNEFFDIDGAFVTPGGTLQKPLSFMRYRAPTMTASLASWYSGGSWGGVESVAAGSHTFTLRARTNASNDTGTSTPKVEYAYVKAQLLPP